MGRRPTAQGLCCFAFAARAPHARAPRRAWPPRDARRTKHARRRRAVPKDTSRATRRKQDEPLGPAPAALQPGHGRLLPATTAGGLRRLPAAAVPSAAAVCRCPGLPAAAAVPLRAARVCVPAAADVRGGAGVLPPARGTSSTGRRAAGAARACTSTGSRGTPRGAKAR